MITITIPYWLVSLFVCAGVLYLILDYYAECLRVQLDEEKKKLRKNESFQERLNEALKLQEELKEKQTK